MRSRLTLFILAILFTALARAATPINQLEVRYLPIGAMLSWNCELLTVTGFNIERSLDGFTFEIISRVVAEKGIADTYNYLDTERPNTKLYYRVTAFDKLGTSAHSPLAEAPAPSQQTWNLTGGFSVDVRDRFAFEVEASSVTLLACDLQDFIGNSVSSHELLVQPGANQLSIPMTDEAPGAYRLRIHGENLDETINFVKLPSEISDAPLVRGN